MEISKFLYRKIRQIYCSLTAIKVYVAKYWLQKQYSSTHACSVIKAVMSVSEGSFKQKANLLFFLHWSSTGSKIFFSTSARRQIFWTVISEDKQEYLLDGQWLLRCRISWHCCLRNLFRSSHIMIKTVSNSHITLLLYYESKHLFQTLKDHVENVEGKVNFFIVNKAFESCLIWEKSNYTRAQRFFNIVTIQYFFT